MNGRWIVAAAIASAAGHAVLAQESAPWFDVASIKENRSGSLESRLRVQPGGRFEWTNTTLKGLIGTAYQRFAFDQRETVGGPDWIDSARFDIVVQTGNGSPPVEIDGFPQQLFEMIRTMLQDRFKLVTHNEVRQAPIYRLTVARTDARLGPGLKRVVDGCGAAMKALSDGQQATARGRRGADCTFGGPPGQVQGNAVTLDMLSRVLGRQVDRPVINATGIDGSFDVDLTFSPEFAPLPPGAAPGEPAPAASDGPSIFAALQEQLGLKLEPARGPVDVLIVDRAERPTGN
jgi:uncharacterized protein (TIGR03435 family)